MGAGYQNDHPGALGAGSSCRNAAAMTRRRSDPGRKSMSDVHLDRALSEEFAGRSAEIHALKASDPAFRALLERNPYSRRRTPFLRISKKGACWFSTRFPRGCCGQQIRPPPQTYRFGRDGPALANATPD
jgi:hypothetical protein